VSALAWAWVYFFSVLSSYYVLRPIRDELGVASGVENLSWLFAGSLTGMVLCNPLFAALVSRLPRRRFISHTYRFFMANLAGFLLLMTYAGPEAHLWVGRAFFIWISVFNMFVVSVFWATLVDLFSRDQGKRLFGFIAAGATIGAITGASLTNGLVGILGSANLLLVSIALLELAVFAFMRLVRAAAVGDAADKVIRQEGPVGGSTLSGIVQIGRSNYLLGICAYMVLFTTLSTFIYFQQAWIVESRIIDRTVRTQFFARIDLAVNVIALAIQVFLTGRIVRRLGVALTLTILPAMTLAGFMLLGVMPTVAAIVAFQVLRRAGDVALARPMREVLFTTVSRDEKYKSKSFIDTFVYRAGDQIGAWSYSLMSVLGLGVVGVSWVAVSLAGLWMFTGWKLGKSQEEEVRRRKPEARSQK
jgi:AAA family ATP:ADP antiporter